jgi:hypothetical protein
MGWFLMPYITKEFIVRWGHTPSGILPVPACPRTFSDYRGFPYVISPAMPCGEPLGVGMIFPLHAERPCVVRHCREYREAEEPGKIARQTHPPEPCLSLTWKLPYFSCRVSRGPWRNPGVFYYMKIKKRDRSGTKLLKKKWEGPYGLKFVL